MMRLIGHAVLALAATPFLFLAVGASEVVTASRFDVETGLRGADYWAGIRRHPAVVNPVGREADGTWMSLAGEWAYTNFPHGCGKRTVKFKTLEPWPLEGRMKVPGIWQAQGLGGPGMGVAHLCQDQSPKMIRGTFRGEVFYRRRIDVPAGWAGRRIWLKVGGVRSRGWFYVNDNAVAMVDAYAGAWKYEITPFVKPGESAKFVVDVDNVVGVRNGQQASVERWGGMVRDLEIEATPQTFIDDAWARGDFDARMAEVHVTVEPPLDGTVPAGLKLRVGIAGRTVEAEAKAGENIIRVPLDDFRPWSPEHPNLYWAEIALMDGGKVAMSRRERFGVRKLEVRGKEFYLNGKPFGFRGFGDDSVYPIDGITPPSREYHLAHMKKASAAGFNFVRLHTHCETPEYFEAADEVGILIQPELAYYLDEPDDYFDYDPIRDAVERWITFRRHPSYAISCSGNEGMLGPGAGKLMYRFLKRLDPDRLVQEQDGGAPETPDNARYSSDFCTGPLNTWERGSFNPGRAFYCHEYMNLSVKQDSRLEKRFTGVWLPPITRDERAQWLAKFGLSLEWGDRLQDSQHALQRYWQKNGIEHARKDPLCGGYCFWTIVDVTVYSEKLKAYTAQGVFDAFWQDKKEGSSPADFAVFNSPSCILVDTENRVRNPEVSEFLAKDWCIPGKPEETNRVYAAGDTIHAEFMLSHYGDDTLRNAKLKWRLASADRELAAGERDVGDQEVGPARTLAKVGIVVPQVSRPVKAALSAEVGGIANSWDFWLFPRESRHAPSARTVICRHGTKEADDARAAGKSLLLLGECSAKPNFRLGWWWIGAQVGTAFAPHPALGDFPYERFLCPLHFRLIKEGSPLPVEGFSEKDFIAVGEGGTAAYLYLAAKVRPDGGREVFASGLDLDSDLPEGIALRNRLLDWLSKAESR